MSSTFAVCGVNDSLLASMIAKACSLVWRTSGHCSIFFLTKIGLVHGLSFGLFFEDYMAMGQNPVPPVTLKSLLKRW